jgi:hypothetical protein
LQVKELPFAHTLRAIRDTFAETKVCIPGGNQRVSLLKYYLMSHVASFNARTGPQREKNRKKGVNMVRPTTMVTMWGSSTEETFAWVLEQQKTVAVALMN